MRYRIDPPARGGRSSRSHVRELRLGSTGRGQIAVDSAAVPETAYVRRYVRRRGRAMRREAAVEALGDRRERAAAELDDPFAVIDRGGATPAVRRRRAPWNEGLGSDERHREQARYDRAAIGDTLAPPCAADFDAARTDVSGLPFDLLDQAKRDRRLLSFSLAELFPSLAPHVLSELDRGDLDAVSAAQQLFKPEPLGENATRDFLLRHVFRLDAAQMQDDSELLRALLRRHYSGKIERLVLDEKVDLVR
jgi:hypothetical protein